MIFINLNRKTIVLVIMILIFSLITATIVTTTMVLDNENKYKSVLAMAQKFEDTNFIAYISEIETLRKKPGQQQFVEVFDINKGEVIITEPASIDIQNEVVNYVKTIKGLYTKVMPFPDKGYVIRIPFDKPISIKQKHLKEAGIKVIDSIFIIVSDKEAPVMLVLDNQQKPNFYIFNANIQPLLDYVKLNE